MATEVVAALIEEGGRLLICRRPEHKARGLLWEFAGGKVEAGESKRQALCRECMEELGVLLSVGDVYAEVTHAYPDLTVHLTLFCARIAAGVPQRLEHAELRWATPQEMLSLEFCPADAPILCMLAGRTPHGACAARAAGSRAGALLCTMLPGPCNLKKTGILHFVLAAV